MVWQTDILTSIWRGCSKVKCDKADTSPGRLCLGWSKGSTNVTGHPVPPCEGVVTTASRNAVCQWPSALSPFKDSLRSRSWHCLGQFTSCDWSLQGHKDTGHWSWIRTILLGSFQLQSQLQDSHVCHRALYFFSPCRFLLISPLCHTSWF